jgi:hypothetical protein
MQEARDAPGAEGLSFRGHVIASFNEFNVYNVFNGIGIVKDKLAGSTKLSGCRFRAAGWRALPPRT